MAYLGAADTFADLTGWPGSYGSARTIVGGRARVTSDVVPNYTGLERTNGTLTGNNFLVEVPTVAPATGVTTGGAYTALWLQSATAGTRLGIEYNAVTGLLAFANQVGYFDGGQVTVTYSATTHRWWQIAHTGAAIVWSTSPDGTTWTTRRTLATPPAWTATDATKPALETFRDSGTVSFAEFDNVNNPPAATPTGPGGAFLPFFGL